MDRLTRHQTQLQYTRTEEEQSTEIQRGWGRLFDGQDAVDSMDGSISFKAPSRCEHTIL